MTTLLNELQTLTIAAFAELGGDASLGKVERSGRPELGQFQCNGALAGARTLKRNPRQIASQVQATLQADPRVSQVTIAGPGFLNITLEPSYLAERLVQAGAEPALGASPVAQGQTVVLDFGGLNVAKAMHVGHLRSLVIGDCLQRLFRALGATVLSDIHLGDWGLQMGMLITEVLREQPDLPYFDADKTDGFPSESPVDLNDLQRLYPKASGRCKADPADMEEAQVATRELQDGRPGYRALWQHFIDVSHAQLGLDFDHLGVHFDLWEGESTVNDVVAPLVADLEARGVAERSDGALVVQVAQDDDKKEYPPLILLKRNGAMLYGTTDVATIHSRQQRFGPSHILYVVDQRQHLHFEQVFRACHKGELCPGVSLEHIGFGTVNGPDGKPFKTRDGGTMRLADMLAQANVESRARMAEADVGAELTDAERDDIAHKVSIAAIKFADLMNHRSSDYVFDLARFTRFEGKTGPYVMYAAVRCSAMLRKAAERGLEVGTLAPATHATQEALMLQLAMLGDALAGALSARAPHRLCDYAYGLAQALSRFYAEVRVLDEADPVQRGSYLALIEQTGRTLRHVLELLGIDAPERM
jgi:arginyl-tRNA synthetase